MVDAYTTSRRRIRLTDTIGRLTSSPTDNCSFFNDPHARISLVIAKEPLGTFKAIAAIVEDGRREALLSETGATVHEALQSLFLRSAEAVQTHIKTAGFDFAAYDDDED